MYLEWVVYLPLIFFYGSMKTREILTGIMEFNFKDRKQLTSVNKNQFLLTGEFSSVFSYKMGTLVMRGSGLGRLCSGKVRAGGEEKARYTCTCVGN